MISASPKTFLLKDYAPPAWLVDTIDLVFDLREDATLVTSTMKMNRNPEARSSSRSLVLDGRQMELVSLRLNEQELPPEAYVVDEETLTIATVPDSFVLIIQSRIHPEINHSLEGLYQSNSMFCTQCEAEGFRRITWFPDRPDVMALFSTTIEADAQKYPVLLSNGNCVNRENLPDNRHRVTWNDPFRKPCYLFALVAGDLGCVKDRFVTRSGREVALEIYVEHENLDQCDHAMRSLKQAMKWDEDTFGLEYDLDSYMIVAVSHFNMGAMENKGLNVFNCKYVLAKPETATDEDYIAIQSVIGHEYFHNWTGNRVTCRDWFQLSLKEGLTVFRDQEFTLAMTGSAVKRIQDVNLLRNHQFREDSGPMAHPVRPESYMEINNFYTVTVYNKGAEVIRMMSNMLGRDGFRKGMDLYFQRHDGQAVTTDDFVKAMEDANQIRLDQFRLWYSLAGTPRITAKGQYNAKQQTYVLNVTQYCPPTPGQSNKPPMHIPMTTALLDSTGKEIPLILENESAGDGATARTLHLTQAKETFCFRQVPSQPVPSLFRGFSAPVRLLDDYSDQDLEFLIQHEQDGFNRWEACQQWMIRFILKLVDKVQHGIALNLDLSFAENIRKLLNSATERSLLSQMLTLPSETYLGDQMLVPDIPAVHQVRLFLGKTVAEALEQDWLRAYESHADTGAYSLDQQAMSRREFRNLCLSWLGRIETQKIRDLALTQYRNSRGMTDRLAALKTLNHIDCVERDTALKHFYETYRHDSLVIDKWLAVQAMSDLSSTPMDVRKLLEHPAFEWTNPNKVRALIGTFCNLNPFHFHVETGKSYEFLGDAILKIEEFNPQIASRMVTPLTQWRRHEPVRQQLMKEQLERILKKQPLSPDVYETVSKSLG
ncbi:MAG: aminopeptidase N [SAR324 cluster bacterium]|nr:aminopeptidase N [SAR324 cluster bacterium]